ncbi:hypothetical protein CHS0354_040247 [Potamilus streckersoni]|uniref:Uncharacterized protein n=1 Tax=Potamilus streckersoni TaxID=2493646 RepID=A0AAE0VQH9_9BIVA|nr:hypothetical protein CHS0354_040247 [Potamilus streckersoni]
MKTHFCMYCKDSCQFHNKYTFNLKQRNFYSKIKQKVQNRDHSDQMLTDNSNKSFYQFLLSSSSKYETVKPSKVFVIQMPCIHFFKIRICRKGLQVLFEGGLIITFKKNKSII